MNLKKLLWGVLFLLLIIGSLHSETHNWAINYSLQKYSTFYGVSKADPLNIMACDNHNSDPTLRQIIKSTNGGITWKMVYNFNDLGWFEIHNISYPTKNFCIASCDSNYFLKTTDGGETWVQFQIKMDLFINGLIHISLLDSLNGIMGSYRNLAYSSDGFKTYRELILPRPLIITDIKLISPTILYVLTASPANFFKYDVSTDIWIENPELFPVYVPEYQTPKNMYFFDSLCGIAVGRRRTGIGDSYYDMIHKTTDGGKTWVEKFNALVFPPGGLTEVDFCDKENGIAVGPQGKIYWTHDAGETWSQDSSKELIKATPAVVHVTILNKSTALIADFSGNMWRTPIGTDVNEFRKFIEFVISPNPATDFIEIQNPNYEKVSIFYILGETIYTTSEATKIDVSSFPSGVYFVRIGDRVQKFIKL